MKIAFDIHGTLDSSQVIRSFVKLLNNCPDYQIFVISGPPYKQIEKELIHLDIILEKNQILSVVDFLRDKGVKMWEDKNGWWCDEEIWWDSKGLICEEYHIDMIFDDKIRYKKNMPNHTDFVLWIG